MKQKSNANTGFIQNLKRDQKDFRRASRWVSDLISEKVSLKFPHDEVNLKPTPSLMLRNEQKIGSRLDHLKQGFSGIFLWHFMGVLGRSRVGNNIAKP